MLKKLDQEFQATLEDETELEKHLAELFKKRRSSLLMAIGLAIYISAHVLFVLITYQSSLSAKTPFGFNVPPGMVLVPLLFVIGVLQWGAKAVIAHCEIRMLLLFKKLREDKIVVTP